MRLIDADELLASLPTCYQDLDDGTLIEAVWKTIQDAETVDAIPIEFIEKQIFRHCDEEESWIFQYLIGLWRKENEDND